MDDKVLEKIKRKKWLFIGLVLVIIVSVIFLLTSPNLMSVKTYKTYLGGCEEVYLDGVLVEGNCSFQRLIYEEFEKDETPYYMEYGAELINLTIE